MMENRNHSNRTNAFIALAAIPMMQEGLEISEKLDFFISLLSRI